MGTNEIRAISPDAFINMPAATLAAFSTLQIRSLEIAQITQIEQSVAYRTGGNILDTFRRTLQATKAQIAVVAPNSIVNPSASDSNIFKLNIILFIACLIKSIVF